ncbi:FkbM family methyltransferase [Maricaulis sp.]|uniref:FkbM family methyltransferase n=1 Tax=Maricaulis sp. TaxID=1486257 RepID=UPI0025BD6BCC|nr:FkbM family methyltransferase [Maricaulis sp.]
MSFLELERLESEIASSVAAPLIADSPNRQGNRAHTATLLEDAFITLVAALAPDLSVEVGAHEASYSKRVKANSPGLTAIAFEANPHVHKAYWPELDQLGIDYRNCAICSESGPMPFFIPRKWAGGEFKPGNMISSLLMRRNESFEYDTVTVDGLTLDAALADTDYRRATAWIDAEGVQREILEGAPGFLSRAQAIFIELESREVWLGQGDAGSIGQMLEQAGFRMVMRDNIARSQYNAVFLKNNIVVTESIMTEVSDYAAKIKSILT